MQFPEPLTDEQEREYLKKMHEGDEDAKNILNLIGNKYNLEGYGYVYEQNIEAGKKIDKEIVLKLKGKF